MSRGSRDALVPRNSLFRRFAALLSSRGNFASTMAPRSNVYDFFDEIERFYKSKKCEVADEDSEGELAEVEFDDPLF
ncbi:hypothetical protein L596_000996 [Steinernema carpocapsae]|uniref:Uncharacterized protein n=1 Tax=Steinernema carpocapsae TaxID=34508 RepID=A0A4U8UK07_STECR|nr:hypothetical protein L596_000996 [Steinernema carpocapsae]